MTAYNSHSEDDVINNLDVVVLAGGVGGAKMAAGLAQVLPSGRLTVIVNSGDDFRHMGLTVCPDLDTVMYTLGGEANPKTGWGRAGETWRTIDEVGRLGGPQWFRLGDLDLATHLVRSDLLDQGLELTEATAHLCAHLGVTQAVLPMSDDEAPTMLETDEGLLSFQDWFVKRQWQPVVKEVRLPEDVRATPAVLRALEKANVVLLAPSNPFVSIDPILNVFPVRAMIADLADVVVAVTPIIGGEALKGPAAKMMRELGIPPTAESVARYFGDLIDVFVYDVVDEGKVRDEGRQLLCTDTIMTDHADRARLAHEVLSYTMELMNQ